MRSILVLLLSASVWASPAAAAAPAAGKAVRVAVLDVRAVGTFDPKSVQGLTSLVASEAQRFAVKVLSGSDLTALIGFEKQKQLLGCSDNSCLAEIGGALGMDYLMTTEVSEVGGVWLLTATLLDVGRAAALMRVTRKARSTGGLVELAGPAAVEALQSIPGLPPPRPSAPDAGTGPGVPEAQATEAAATSGQRVAGYAVASAGAAMLVGGAACGFLAMDAYGSARNATDDARFAEARSRGKATALAADALFGVGAAALAVGVLLAVTAPSSSAPVTVTPMVGGGGAGLVVQGGF